MILISRRGEKQGIAHLIAHRAGSLTEVLSESLEINLEQTNFLLRLGCIYLKGQRLLAKDAALVHLQKEDYLRAEGL